MSKIPTAEEFLKTRGHLLHPEEVLIEFAKLHAKEALKEASEQVQSGLEYSHHEGEFEDIPVYLPIVNKDSILNAYPLENIK